MKLYLLLFVVSFITLSGYGQAVTLNAASSGSTLTAAQSGAGPTQFNCGSTFTDGSGNYLNRNSAYTITLCAGAGQYLSITFTQVDVASGGTGNTDAFTYNTGSGNISIPDGVGYGGSNPATFTVETSVGGCVTFTLTTNNNGGSGANNLSNNAGFSSTISCITPPPNDNPCGALPLTAFNQCNPTLVSNVGATNTTGYPGVSTCAGYNGSDVWYTVEVPSDGNITFRTTAGTITDGGLAVYSSSNGQCTGTLTQVFCNDDCPSPGSLMPCISISNLSLAGQTVWIRVYEFGGNFEGDFSVCAIGNVGDCEPTTADCLGAIPVCSNESYSNLASGQGCVSDLNSTNDGCLNGEHNMTYYLIRIGTSGTWGFNGTFPITSNGIEYDWLLYKLSDNPIFNPSACNLPSTGPIRCSYASQAGKSEVAMGMVENQPEFTEGSSPSGDGYVHWLDNAVAGEYYLLGIDRWSTAGGSYTINFTGTAQMSCDFYTPLPITLTDFSVEIDERNNKLVWTVASQINNNFFTIEKSKDGNNWTKLADIQGAGTTQEIMTYTTLDENPQLLTYYRLKQTDFDGQVETFETISIFRHNTEDVLFTDLFPNPAGDRIYFNYSGNNFDEPIEITIWSTENKKIFHTIYEKFDNYQSLNIDCMKMQKGVYTATIRQGQNTEHKIFNKF